MHPLIVVVLEFGKCDVHSYLCTRIAFERGNLLNQLGSTSIGGFHLQTLVHTGLLNKRAREINVVRLLFST